MPTGRVDASSTPQDSKGEQTTKPIEEKAKSERRGPDADLGERGDRIKGLTSALGAGLRLSGVNGGATADNLLARPDRGDGKEAASPTS
jgi:hypothetical protein